MMAIKPLAEQIEEFKNDPRFHVKIERYTHAGTQEVTQWNWDEEWDGELIRDVSALQDRGFTIVKFSRKRKITILKPKDYDRNVIVHAIELAVGSGWKSISFGKNQIDIYWQGRTSLWGYR